MKHDDDKARRRGLRWKFLLVLAVMWSWMACDTVAEITFLKETLQSTTVLGFRAEQCGVSDDPLSTCLPPGCGKLDFVLESNQGRFLTPNLQIVDLEGRLSPGINYGNDSTDIEFVSSWLFELDALGQDKDCSADASICSAPFTCQALGSSDLPADDANVGRQRCVVQADLDDAVGSLSFTALGADPQPDNSNTTGLGFDDVALATLLDNSGSLIGLQENGQIVDGTQTDRRNRRLSALVTFYGELNAPARSTITGSEYALFELSGTSTNGVTDVFGGQTSVGNRTWQDDVAVVQDFVQEVGNSPGGLTPTWEGFVAASAAFNESAPGGAARRALLVTDSGPDGSAEQRTAQTAIDALAAGEGSATIVHFDNPTRDDMENRTGPIAGYDQIACETGGYYIYELYPDGLAEHMRRLGVAYEGKWSVDINVTARGTGGGVLEMADLPPGWYRLATTMRLQLANNTETVNLQLTELGGAFSEGQTVDTRLLFHVPDASTP